MNLRILKKLSRRAAPLLPILGDTREQFPAEDDGNYVSVLIERKHWERSGCHPTYQPRNDWSGNRGREIVFTSRAGRRLVMRSPSAPRKGTMMIGGMSGYYEPEWGEESAWEALLNLIHVEFTAWEAHPPALQRPLRSPAEVFRAAYEIAAQRQAKAARRSQRRAA